MKASDVPGRKGALLSATRGALRTLRKGKRERIDDVLAQAGRHETAIAKIFHGRMTFEGSEPVFEYPLSIIAFTNRSGSNLLAERMRSTGLLAGFGELLSPAPAETAIARGARSYPEFFVRNDRRYRKDAAVYGYKSSWEQLLMLLRAKIDRMHAGVRIVHIERRDPIRQAISYAIAEQTETWTADQAAKSNSIQFDYDAIQHRIRNIATSNGYIRYIAHDFALPLLSVTYEDLVADPAGTIGRVCDFHDLELSADWSPGETKLQRQANELNEEFYRRYVEASRKTILGGGPG